MSAGCTSVFFREANHWLYLEEPEIFNTVVSTFVLLGDVEAVVAKYPSRIALEC